jgi:mRNA interferase RelE/StbE
MPYLVEVSPAAQRDLRRLSAQDLPRLRVAIEALSDSPRPLGVLKLRGQERTWRIRVAPYRVIYYEVYDGQRLVLILKVDRRSEGTYR